MLIDFRELVGEHSGENMAEAVWQTLETYGLLGRVCKATFLCATLIANLTFAGHRICHGQCVK
jgi:NADPH-dependent glutamate synthase beta subunit-like oxidoreductase